MRGRDRDHDYARCGDIWLGLLPVPQAELYGGRAALDDRADRGAPGGGTRCVCILQTRGDSRGSTLCGGTAGGAERRSGSMSRWKRFLAVALVCAAVVTAWARAHGQEPGLRTVHVFVALADNQHQGIVPVPAKLGNGEDAERNLYWGSAYGVKTFFSRSAD